MRITIDICVRYGLSEGAVRYLSYLAAEDSSYLFVSG